MQVWFSLTSRLAVVKHSSSYSIWTTSSLKQTRRAAHPPSPPLIPHIGRIHTGSPQRSSWAVMWILLNTRINAGIPRNGNAHTSFYSGVYGSKPEFLAAEQLRRYGVLRKCRARGNGLRKAIFTVVAAALSLQYRTIQIAVYSSRSLQGNVMLYSVRPRFEQFLLHEHDFEVLRHHTQTASTLLHIALSAALVPENVLPLFFYFVLLSIF